MYPRFLRFYKAEPAPFNILREFSALDTRGKIVLCDHLFIEGYLAFERKAHLLWKRAETKDIKKLETFLNMLKKDAH